MWTSQHRLFHGNETCKKCVQDKYTRAQRPGVCKWPKQGKKIWEDQNQSKNQRSNIMYRLNVLTVFN